MSLSHIFILQTSFLLITVGLRLGIGNAILV